MVQNNNINNNINTDKTVSLSLLPPTSDYVFYNLFGVEENSDCLISLLNAILKNNPYVYSLKLRPTEHKKTIEDGKSIRADILADINNNTIVNIEMQCSNMSNSIDRMLFYQAIHRSRSIDAGTKYTSMPQIISIWILNSTMYDDLDHYTHEIKMCLHDGNGMYIRTASEKERIIVIELDKMSKYIESINQQHNDNKTQTKLNMFESWMNFLTNPLTATDSIDEDNTIHKAFEKLKGMSSNPEIRAEYNQMMRERSELDMRYDEGRGDGLKEGIEIGREEGREEGIEIGAKRNSVEIAKSLLSMGLTVEQVINVTKLEHKDIIEIQKSM